MDSASNHNLDQLDPRQYQRLYWEEDTPIKDITQGVKGQLYWVASILFVAIITTSYVVKFPDQIELPFVLKSEIQEEVFKFPFIVYTHQKFVTAGDTVKKGQALMKITSPEIIEWIGELRRREDQLMTFEKYGKNNLRKKQNIITNDIASQQNQLSQLKKELEILDVKWLSRQEALSYAVEDTKENHRALESLYRDSIVAKHDAMEAKNIYLKSLDEFRTQEAEYKQSKIRLETQINNLNKVIGSLILSSSEIDIHQISDSTSFVQNVDLAEHAIKSIFPEYSIEGGNIILRSPSDAIVSYLYDGEQELSIGSTLIKLTNSTMPDYAFVKCPPSSMGRIKKGMKSLLKVSSFPYYEWGTVEGHIMHLSLTADENGLYNIHINLDKPGRLENHLFSGLTGKALIVLEERTLLHFFFYKLSEQYHRVMNGDF